MHIANGRLITPSGIVEGKALVVKNGQIAGLCPDAEAPADNEVIDAGGRFIAPGLIDLHVHGADGADFCDGTVDDIRRIAAYHARYGVTAMAATIASCTVPEQHQALAALRETMRTGTGGAAVLGAHLEGPFLHPEKKGCHLRKFLRLPLPGQFEDIIEQSDIVRHVTIAPDLEGAIDCIRKLSAAGIVVSGGHTLATSDTIADAIAAGMTHTTHLWCAMSRETKHGPYRSAGLAEISLLDDRLTTEIIADGHHLPPEMMKLALKCKGVDRLCLVSDAMRGTGMPVGGRYTFGSRDGQIAVMEEGCSVMPDRSGFASSTTPLGCIVATAARTMDISIVDAVRMASSTPAGVLGLSGSKGSLEPGKDADIILFEDPSEITCTIVAGEVVFRHD